MSSPATWVYAVLGALLPVACLVVRQWGEDEGGDVLLVLGPLFLVVGALVGGLVGLVANDPRRR